MKCYFASDLLSPAGWTALAIAFIASVILCLTGCRQTISANHFDDHVLSVEDHPQAVVALGFKGYYVLAGAFRMGTLKALPGEMVILGDASKHYFPIRELLVKYPEYASPRTVGAAQKQERDILKFVTESK